MVVSGLGGTEGLGPWWCQGWVVLRVWGRGGVMVGWY